MTEEVKKLWGEELSWIKDNKLREAVAKTWETALERSVLIVNDLKNNSVYTALRARFESNIYGP